MTRWTFRGSQQGQFQGIAPTGKQIKVEGISIQRIEDGKIVEYREIFEPVLPKLGFFRIPTLSQQDGE